MKDLMGKVPTDNIYVRPTRPTRDLHSNLYYGEEARIDNKLETALHSDTLSTKGASGTSWDRRGRILGINPSMIFRLIMVKSGSQDRHGIQSMMSGVTTIGYFSHALTLGSMDCSQDWPMD